MIATIMPITNASQPLVIAAAQIIETVPIAIGVRGCVCFGADQNSTLAHSPVPRQGDALLSSR